MRERILRRVVLPAPLRPMRPRTSPSLTSKETSLRAQKVSSLGRRKTDSGERKNASREWRRPPSTCKPRRYSLPSPSPWMTVLDIVGTFERWNVRTEGIELAVEELALSGSGVSVGLAEGAVFADEEEVDLGEGAVERAVENGIEVVDDETDSFHVSDQVVELRAADHGGEKGAFEHDDFGVLESARGAGKDLKLCALNVKLDEIGAGE